MGEYAGSALENYNPKLTAGEDMSTARDIAKRFEQLESQVCRCCCGSRKINLVGWDKSNILLTLSVAADP